MTGSWRTEAWRPLRSNGCLQLPIYVCALCSKAAGGGRGPLLQAEGPSGSLSNTGADQPRGNLIGSPDHRPSVTIACWLPLGQVPPTLSSSLRHRLMLRRTWYTAAAQCTFAEAKTVSSMFPRMVSKCLNTTQKAPGKGSAQVSLGQLPPLWEEMGRAERFPTLALSF
jgi:hypothetical protein